MASQYPVRVVQFGGGAFLRAFAGPLVQGMNDRAGFAGSVLLVKPQPGPVDPAFAAQDYRYHVVVRGSEAGVPVADRQEIRVLAGAVSPTEDFEAYLAAARLPEVRLIISNTTEAGIVFREADRADDRPAASFPGKLTQFLWARYRALGSGAPELAVVPCELIEKNGRTLRSFVEAHADRWFADPEFRRWLDTRLVWYDTLVDRIVPGHDPAERDRCRAETGFDDALLTVAEPYRLLVLEGPEREDLLPAVRSGFPALWTNDLTPWRSRKVAVLNGGHTFLAMVGLGLGLTTVRQALEHPLLGRALGAFFDTEVLPGLPFPPDEARAYRDQIADRYANPFVDHRLADIALNTVSKTAARLLPGARIFEAGTGRPPGFTALALGALLNRYLHTEGVRDEARVLDLVRTAAASDPEVRARRLLEEGLWPAGALSPDLIRAAAARYVRIREAGTAAALSEELSHG